MKGKGERRGEEVERQQQQQQQGHWGPVPGSKKQHINAEYATLLALFNCMRQLKERSQLHK